MQPSLHKPVPMNSRVVIPSYFHASKSPVLGTVVGISSMHVIFTYIVLLDEPIETEFGQMRAVVVNGAELTAEDGSDWRLTSQKGSHEI